MRADEIGVGLGDGPHPDLVVGPGPEGGEGGAEGDGPVAAGNAHDDAGD